MCDHSEQEVLDKHKLTLTRAKHRNSSGFGPNSGMFRPNLQRVFRGGEMTNGAASHAVWQTREESEVEVRER
jgi:hypothetical protein